MPTYLPYKPTAAIRAAFEKWMSGTPRSVVKQTVKRQPGYSLRETFIKLLGVTTWAQAKARRAAAVKKARTTATKEGQ